MKEKKDNFKITLISKVNCMAEVENKNNNNNNNKEDEEKNKIDHFSQLNREEIVAIFYPHS